jgi:hypothetical protein
MWQRTFDEWRESREYRADPTVMWDGKALHVLIPGRIKTGYDVTVDPRTGAVTATRPFPAAGESWP